MGGSSKKQTVGYKYYAGEHLALCRGPIDNITEISVDDRVAWTGEAEGGTITINAPDLFGGEKREGGISGAVDLCFGGPAQTVNTYLQSILGAVMPAFRGIAAVVLKQCYLGNNPYLKPWSFRAKRIHVRGMDGDEQWYDEKAEIPSEFWGVDAPPPIYPAYLLYVGTVDYEGEIVYSQFGGFQTAEIIDTGFDVDDNYYGTVRFRNYNDLGALVLTQDLTQKIPDFGVSHATVDGDPVYFKTTIIYNAEYGFAVSANTIEKINFYPSLTGDYEGYSPTLPFNADPIDTITYWGNKYWAINESGVNIFNSSFAHIGEAVVPNADVSNQSVQIIQDPATANFYVIWKDSNNSDVLIGQFVDTPSTLLWSDTLFGSGQAARGVHIYNDYVVGRSDDVVRLFKIGGSGVTLEDSIPREIVSNDTLNQRIAYFYPITGIDLDGGFEGGDSPLIPYVINENRVYRIDREIGSQLAPRFYSGDMNPAHIIREDLTDPKADGGQGYQDADVDDTYFVAAADTLFNEGMGMSLLWDTPSDHEAFIELVLRHINGALRLDHATGKFQLKLLRDDYDIGDLVTLDGSNISKVEDFNRPSFGDLINTVIVKYWDAATNTIQSISVDDPVLVQQQGGVNSTTIEYLGFTNADISSKAASRDLQSLSAPLASFTVYADRSAASLNIGDPFIVDMPDEGINEMVVRVLSGSFGDGKSHEIKLKVAQDVFAFPAVAVVAEEDAGWVNPATDPVAADYRVVVEAPYYELVQRFGQTAVDDIIATNGDIGYLLAAAVRPENEINADFVVDSGAGYDLAASVAMDFCPSATLVTGVDYVETEWSIENGINLDQVSVGTHAQINDELFRVDAIDADAGTLTVGRGVLDTVPAQHLAGDRILFWDAYSETDGTEYADGEEVSVKILPATGKGVLDIDDATADSLTFDQRANRPYPPAAVQVTGEYYPESVGALFISWVGRDRTQQTSGELFDYFDANIGPEAGVTYNGYVYNDDTDALLVSATDISSPWFAEIEADFITVRIELEAERAGLISYQRFVYSLALIPGNGDATITTFDNDTRITQSGDTRITED